MRRTRSGARLAVAILTCGLVASLVAACQDHPRSPEPESDLDAGVGVDPDCPKSLTPEECEELRPRPPPHFDAGVPELDAGSDDGLTCAADAALVPRGTFKPLGSSTEAPVGTLCVDLRLVTVADYQRCVLLGGCRQPHPRPPLRSKAASGGRADSCNWRVPGRDEHPMNCVSFEDSSNFCQQMGRRLPNRAELEWAARGGARATAFPWGGDSPAGRACWKDIGTCAVDSYPWGHSPQGIADLAGNVWEWTSSPGSSAEHLVLGGAWNGTSSDELVAGNSRPRCDDCGSSDLGFRCVAPPMAPLSPPDLDAGPVVVEPPSPQPAVTLFAGDGVAGFADGSRPILSDGGRAARPAEFAKPGGLAVDRRGHLFVADLGNGAVREVDPDGNVTTFARLTGTSEAHPSQPTDLAFDPSGVLLVTDSQNNCIAALYPNGSLSYEWGPCDPNTSSHSLALCDMGGRVCLLVPRLPPELARPWALAFDPGGHLLVADRDHDRVVRRDYLHRDTDHDETIAGRLHQDRSSKLKLSSNLPLVSPQGVAADRRGNIYVADSGQDRICRVADDGQVTVFAGTGAPGFVDGRHGAFRHPSGLAMDRGGILYVADTGNHRVRWIDPNGVVSTLIGPKDPELAAPTGLALDGQGNLFVSDALGQRIWRVRLHEPADVRAP